MSLPATDDFNRADSITIGSNYTFRLGTIAVDSNRAKRGGSGSGSAADNFADWSADVFADDQYSQGKGYDSSFTQAPSVTVRASVTGASTNAYILQAYNGSYFLVKIVSGSFFILGTYAVTPVNGDVLRVEVEGTTLRGYVNGGLLGSVTDASLSSGSAGIRIYSEVALVAAVDDWEGGDLVTARRFLMTRF